jgi:hypothetical protein
MGRCLESEYRLAVKSSADQFRRGGANLFPTFVDVNLRIQPVVRKPSTGPARDWQVYY